MPDQPSLFDGGDPPSCPTCPHLPHPGAWCPSCNCYSGIEANGSFEYSAREHARTDDPDTSHQAAERVTSINSDCAALLRTYAATTRTAHEAGGIAGLDDYAASKRNSDLIRMGFIEPVLDEHGKEVTRLNTSSNRQARVCSITPGGLTKLQELQR